MPAADTGRPDRRAALLERHGGGVQADMDQTGIIAQGILATAARIEAVAMDTQHAARAAG